MSISIKLKKGFDIRLLGRAEKIIAGEVNPSLFAVKPVDFPGLTPKLDVRPGDPVKAGTPLFHDKVRPEIRYVSPVSGTVLTVSRGEKRRILEVIVKREREEYIDFGSDDTDRLSREVVIEKLLVSGLWPAIRQRPYNVVADPNVEPKSVFISGFDSAPLAPDYNFIAENSPVNYFRKGIAALSRMTKGKVNLILNGNDTPGMIPYDISGVEVSYFSGPHPSGNVGVHIHHLDPVNKGETVWYVNLQDVFSIGRLFVEGIYKPEKIIALTGSEVKEPRYYRILTGGSVSPAVEGNIKQGNLRFISGNVLTGTRISQDGFLGFYDSQITVIPEGNYHEFFGWASPGINKFSFSRTFLSSLFPRQAYKLDTNLHGGERAFVITGQYEKVVPMDIYPMQLLKAIMAEDIDMMENLGIYEVAEEDFALCEFICPSKIEIQSVIRNGLDLMRKEMS
ncbi:MAG: Na(+)-translocating NADH-quinone reductase subunit A [Bacteroidales bacterium]|jgi:Na+-transporting NADH:ubiquinone oxidoreductase subunit A|nr:Na(+)-translocating NADH-quinone reductase subunit A [Bacteroidales bacterium]